ncbi:MAG: hypothetical protein IIZ05_00540 [Firmicutes bacterium]|nr:hypothetical protein [Bacillota bacterium]
MAEGINLAKAYVQIVPSAKGIASTLSDEMNGAAEKAGKSTGKTLASGIGSALGAGAAAIGTGLAVATTSVAALSKSALSAYADYEQLTGGVETLFKDSADVVMQYADNAYKTSGLSANEYMETVTSFSASLLQSLDGDTAAAAEYAQTAITDMSDNANKMGTSMESIQNAYQGFAKQNYTMLDNLKLGYGGTKSEMQRLLEDATELSGVEYDIESYADIVAAIHVVQDNLGITGTTAKEASETISGSVASMRSAWANFLTSMNRSPEQLDKATSDLVDTVVTTVGNIIPKLASIIPNVINGLSSLVQALMPQIPVILGTLLPSLISGASLLLQELVTALPALLDVLSAVIPDVIQAIFTMLPMLLEAALVIVENLAQGLIAALPTLIPAAVDMILTLVTGLLEHLDDIIGLAIDLVVALADGIIDAIPILVEAIPKVIMGLVNALQNPDNLAKLAVAAVKILVELRGACIQAIPQLLAAVPQIIKGLVDAFKENAKKLVEVGPDIVAGLWNGIKNNWDTLISGIKDLAGDMISGIKGIFGIHSPSTVFANIGEMCDKGLAAGLSGMSGTVADTKKMLSDEMGSGFAVDTTMKVQRSLSQNGYTAASESSNLSSQIAGAIYSALTGLTLNAEIKGTPNVQKLFDSMRAEAKLYKNRTGQEAFV